MADEPINNYLYRLGQSVLLGGTGLDIGSTAAVLNQGGREQNPIYGINPSVARLIAMKALPTAGAMWAMHKMAPNHPKLAGTLGMALGSVPMLAGIHNLGQLK